MPKKTIKKLNNPIRTILPKVNYVNNKLKIVEIDGNGEILGRLATRVANILRGKDTPGWRPNKICGKKVVIINARNIKVTGNKLEKKVYYHHTGYIGHLKSETMKEVILKDPTEVLRRAVTGMLPKNKLQSLWLKNLEIREGV